MKKLVAISLALLLCFSTFSVAAVKKTTDETARYIKLGEVCGYTLVYDTETPLADESYTRIIGDYYFTSNSELLGLSLSDGESIVGLESAYGSLIGDSGIKSAAKIINECKENGTQPFDKWTVTKGAPEPVTPATDPHDKLDTGSGKVYYLFGWINGRNYACQENDYEMGEYRFENGRLTATFAEDAYVGVKEENNAAWYMTNGWLGTNVTSATLYNTSITGANSNKLYVPAGIEFCFTLDENTDGSLTLSYVPFIGEDPSQGDVPGGAPPSGDWGDEPESTTYAPTTAPTGPGVCGSDPTEQQTHPTESHSVEPSEPSRPIESEVHPSSQSESTRPTENPTANPETDPTEPIPTAKPATPSTETPIKLNIIAATLQAGKVITLKATDKNGKKLSVTFSSSNKKVAKVTSKGKIYALKRGTARITVKYKKKKATCLVNVVTSPKLSKNKIKLKKGQTKFVKISGKCSGVKNTYKNTKIAKVKSSRTAKKLKIRGLKKGTTNLTIKVNGVKLKLKVTVI